MSADLLVYAQTGLSAVLLLAGLFFVLSGAIGVIRLPDFYTRLHAAGMTDTLGAELIISGLVVQAGFSQTSLKLLLIAFILFLTSPAATHAVVNAAYHAGLEPLLGKYRAPLPGAPAVVKKARKKPAKKPVKKTAVRKPARRKKIAPKHGQSRGRRT